MQTIKSERATQIPEAKIAARIPRDRLYRMSKDFFDTIDRLALGHRGRRLLHGLIHATCKKNDDWHSRHVLPLGECRVACQVLRQRLDMKGSDNRSLAAGLNAVRGRIHAMRDIAAETRPRRRRSHLRRRDFKVERREPRKVASVGKAVQG